MFLKSYASGYITENKNISDIKFSLNYYKYYKI